MSKAGAEQSREMIIKPVPKIGEFEFILCTGPPGPPLGRLRENIFRVRTSGSALFRHVTKIDSDPVPPGHWR
jgi:hypothetical protein